MEHLMTSEEIAEFLHVDPVTIRRLVNKGDLAAYRIGADFRFAPSDLQSYLERQRIPAAAEHEGETEAQAKTNLSTWARQVLQRKQVPSDRFDRFTKRARQVLQLATDEAHRLNHNYVGTEHILLGLVSEGQGIAGQVLIGMGVKLDQVRDAVETIIGRGNHTSSGALPLTPRSKKVIELGVDEARRLGHHFLGTEHILLGLLREGEGVAAGILQDGLGLQLEQIRLETLRLVSQFLPNDLAPDEVIAAQQQEQAPAPPIPPEAASLLPEGVEGVTCPRCGARNPAYFHHCFNCGQALSTPEQGQEEPERPDANE